VERPLSVPTLPEAISPNGELAAWVANDARVSGGPLDVVVVALHGATEPVRLRVTDAASGVGWVAGFSPDGRAVLVGVDGDPMRTFYWAPLDGTAPALIGQGAWASADVQRVAN
jgi:hypothetical protein